MPALLLGAPRAVARTHAFLRPRRQVLHRAPQLQHARVPRRVLRAPQGRVRHARWIGCVNARRAALTLHADPAYRYVGPPGYGVRCGLARPSGRQRCAQPRACAQGCNASLADSADCVMTMCSDLYNFRLKDASLRCALAAARSRRAASLPQLTTRHAGNGRAASWTHSARLPWASAASGRFPKSHPGGWVQAIKRISSAR